MNIGFRFAERGHEHRAEDALSRYVVRTEARPMRQWLELAGPGRALRLIRDGSPDFSSFGELAKSLVRPGLSELERAMAIYRFSARHFYNASMGWGDTEMTRFINAFGYSFCWGQADFQHLLYEAAGLRARAPLLKGHSSTEVFVDGAWRMLDAYMRLMAPAPDLSGLATGDDLHRHPGIFDAIRSAARAETAKDYWSIHGPGGTYEPHADSAAMRLHLRRGESVRFDLDRRERWALAPAEPADFCNGRWFWQPTLDAAHLERDVQRADNVAAGAEGLAPHKAHAPALLDYRIECPWPLLAGSVSFGFTAEARVTVDLFDARRHDWIPLHRGSAREVAVSLDTHLSTPVLPPSCNMHQRAHIPDVVRGVVLRVAWHGPAACSSVAFDLTLQAHRPSLPALEAGENHWTLLAEAPGASVRHGWTEFPGLTASSAQPCEGEPVRLAARVHNRGTRPALDVPVAFVQDGAGVVLGRTTLARIEPDGWAEAAIDWPAAIHGDRAPQNEAGPRRYVDTRIRAEVDAPQNAGNALAAAAETSLVVLAHRPPILNETLVWSGPGADPETVILRAAVVHPDGDSDGRLVYLQPVTCAASVQPFAGHPGQGGTPLAEPRRLAGILASEFAVAEWSIRRSNLPADGIVSIAMQPESPAAGVPPGDRVLVRHQVKIP